MISTFCGSRFALLCTVFGDQQAQHGPLVTSDSYCDYILKLSEYPRHAVCQVPSWQCHSLQRGNLGAGAIRIYISLSPLELCNAHQIHTAVGTNNMQARKTKLYLSSAPRGMCTSAAAVCSMTCFMSVSAWLFVRLTRAWGAAPESKMSQACKAAGAE